MSWSKAATIILITPFVLSIALWMNDFVVNTSETLTLFVSLVWGILLALAGGFYFVSKIDFSRQKKNKQFMKSVSEKIQGVTVSIFFHTVIFVFLAFMYPIRHFIGKFIPLNLNLKSLYDSFLFVEIIIPSLASILIGIWCIVLITNQKSE